MKHLMTRLALLAAVLALAGCSDSVAARPSSKPAAGAASAPSQPHEDSPVSPKTAAAPSRAVPPIDALQPAATETATFAVG